MYKTITPWICECGTQNAEFREICCKCGKDKHKLSDKVNEE